GLQTHDLRDRHDSLRGFSSRPAIPTSPAPVNGILPQGPPRVECRIALLPGGAAMSWTVIFCTCAAAIALLIIRPWRFWGERRYSAQCRKLLPRWDAWGWKDNWTCARCGCQVGR